MLYSGAVVGWWKVADWKDAAAGLVVRWLGCWNSAVDTTAFVAAFSVGLAAGFEGY